MRQWARIRVDRLCDLYRHHIPDPDGIVLRKQQLLSLCDEHYCRVTPRKGLRGEEEEKRRYRPYLKSCTTVTHGLPACEEVVVVRPRKRSLTRLASRVVRSSLRQVSIALTRKDVRAHWGLALLLLPGHDPGPFEKVREGERG